MKKILANIEEIIAGLALAVLIVLVCLNVIIRFTTTKSINWLEEIVFMCFAYVIFLGASAAFKRNLHSGIDLVVRKLSKRNQAIVSVISTLVLLLTCVAVTYLSFSYAVASGLKKTPILRIPYFFIDISVTLGFALMCIHCVSFIKNIFKYHDFFRDKQLYSGIYNYETNEIIPTDSAKISEEGKE